MGRSYGQNDPMDEGMREPSRLSNSTDDDSYTVGLGSDLRVTGNLLQTLMKEVEVLYDELSPIIADRTDGDDEDLEKEPPLRGASPFREVVIGHNEGLRQIHDRLRELRTRIEL